MVEWKSAEGESKQKQTVNGKQTLYFMLHAIIAGLVHLAQVSLIASLELARIEYFDPLSKWTNMNVREGSILVLESEEWIFFFFSVAS